MSDNNDKPVVIEFVPAYLPELDQDDNNEKGLPVLDLTPLARWVRTQLYAERTLRHREVIHE